MIPAISPPISPPEWRRVAVLTVLLVLVAAVPYALAYAAPAPYVFAGAIFNPFDAQSYLAKMQLGWHGAWAFDLPYTAEPVPGVFIYTYYLFLGHLARWTGLGVELVFHLARMLAGGFLFLSAYRFIAHFFETPRARLWVWLLYALGSGLGWAAMLGGLQTSDLWVAEAYPFLSALSNSHFCLTAALMLWILEWTLAVPEGETPRRRLVRLGALALAVTVVAQLQPMALVVVGVVLAVATGVQAWRDLKLATWRARFLWPGWWPLVVVGVCSVPWVAFDAWAMLTVFKGWNAQNLTLSPPLWDALLSGGVPLALAGAGSVAVGVSLRWRRPTTGFFPLLWLALNIVMLYAPWSLQRRLSLGIWMPIAILAGIGWREVVWPQLKPRVRPLVLGGVMLAATLSNVLIFVLMLSVIPQAARWPLIFITRDEAAGLAWLGEHTHGEVVLAGPEMGLFIPAQAEARVYYGHPFETVDAPARQQDVEGFFSGQAPPDDYLTQYPASYIFYGPRERELGGWPVPPGWHVVFQQGEVSIYAR